MEIGLDCRSEKSVFDIVVRRPLRRLTSYHSYFYKLDVSAPRLVGDDSTTVCSILFLTFFPIYISLSLSISLLCFGFS